MPDVHLFLGGYGSGKSELSLQTALTEKARNGGPVTLIDLDILNPCLRSAEQRALLADAGVACLAPTFAGTNLDMPVLPAQIEPLLTRPGTVVIDVGGDPEGAVALGRYHHPLHEAGYTALYVINTLRPLQQTLPDLLALYHAITQRARVQPTGVALNTNLARETVPHHLTGALPLAEAFCAAVGVPLAAITGLPAVLEALPADFAAAHTDKLLSLDRLRMRPDWFDLR